MTILRGPAGKRYDLPGGLTIFVPRARTMPPRVLPARRLGRDGGTDS